LPRRRTTPDFVLEVTIEKRCRSREDGRNQMRWLLVLIISNGIILLAATVHIRRSAGPKSRTLSSLLLLALTAMAVFILSQHACEEGTAPPFVVFGTAVIAAGCPWLLPRRPWAMRGAIAVVVSCGIVVAQDLTNSYHRNSITGNPDYASGRFWHTSLTGQYPRDPSKTHAARLKRISEAPMATATNREPWPTTERQPQQH